MSAEISPPDTDRLEFDTRLTAVDHGRFALARPIDTGWWVVNGPNGGYIAALLLRAMSEATRDDERVPRSLTVHYTSPPAEGPADIETEVLRSGRSLSSVTARLSQETPQGAKLRAFAIAAISKPRDGAGFVDLRMPEAPPAADLAPFESMLPIHERYDIRFLPGAGRDAGSDHAQTAGWIRLAAPGRTLDAQLLAAYADAMPPAVFALAGGIERFGPVPTVDLTIHFRNPQVWATIGPDDHCLAVFRTRLKDGAFLEEDGEIWSADGHLLALSRQLAIGLS